MPGNTLKSTTIRAPTDSFNEALAECQGIPYGICQIDRRYHSFNEALAECQGIQCKRPTPPSSAALRILTSCAFSLMRMSNGGHTQMDQSYRGLAAERP